MSEYPGLNDDFRDLLEALHHARAEFLVVGAHAMAAHGVARATGDLDVFVNPAKSNARRVLDALVDFGAPLERHGVGVVDFEVPGTVYQIGLPPRRIDILTEISGVPFEAALAGHIVAEVDGLSLPILGKAELIANKRAAARPKDILDADLLERTLG